MSKVVTSANAPAVVALMLPAELTGQVIDRYRQSIRKTGRVWLPLGSAMLGTLGVLLLAWSLLPSPVLVNEPASPSDWHAAPHASEGARISGLALHPAPGVAVLAASLTPASAPTAIRSVPLGPESSEPADSSPSAGQPGEQP